MTVAPPAEPKVYTAAALVIGDELLSGRIQDANLVELARFLSRHGVDLKQARFIGDEPEVIVAAVRELGAGHDYLFTMGGMGPTHDDITVECVAAALGLPLEVNAEMEAAIRLHWGDVHNDARRRLTLAPRGAILIGDPKVSPAGMRVGDVIILAGLPQAMRRSLQNLDGQIMGGAPVQARILRLLRPDESAVAAPLRQAADLWPDLVFGSYPFFASNVFGCDLVVRGRDPHRLDLALAQLRALLDAAGLATDIVVEGDGR